MLLGKRFGVEVLAHRNLAAVAQKRLASNQGQYRVVDHSFDAVVVGAGKNFDILFHF